MSDDYEFWTLPMVREPFLADLGTTNPSAELDAAVRVAEDGISSLLGKIANRMLGRPEVTAEGHLDYLRAQGDLTDAQRDAAALDWHLVKMQIARRLGLDQTGEVINARRFGASWQVIGEACGITRQAAYDRWGAIAAEVLADLNVSVKEDR